MNSTRNLEEIQSRLAEITTEQDAHAARDFDTELADALAQGGDVDALEQQHLDAERIARRLRVERQALEAALPAARIEHARTALAPLKREHTKAVKAATAAATKANDAWQDLQSAVAEFEAARQEAYQAAGTERAMLTQMGAGDEFKDRLGVPVSAEMALIAGSMMALAPQAAELGRVQPGLVMAGFQAHTIEVQEVEQ